MTQNGSGYQCKNKGECRRGYRPFLRLVVSTVKIVGEDDSEAMMNGSDVDVTCSGKTSGALELVMLPVHRTHIVLLKCSKNSKKN